MKQGIDNLSSGRKIRLTGVPGSAQRGLRSTSLLPIPFFRAWRSALRRKWNHSIVRIMAHESGSLVQRIQAIRRNNMLLDGFGIVLNPCGYSMANREQWNTFQYGCIDHI